MSALRIRRGRHYRRRDTHLAFRRLLLHLLDWTACRFGRHGRLVMRMRAAEQRKHIGRIY